jgi:hypothetical protein
MKLLGISFWVGDGEWCRFMYLSLIGRCLSGKMSLVGAYSGRLQKE